VGYILRPPCPISLASNSGNFANQVKDVIETTFLYFFLHISQHGLPPPH